MGVVQIIAGVLIFAIVMVILLQPIILLVDNSADILGNATTKYGTDPDGNIVAVGSSSAFPDMTLALIAGLGFFITLGFIIWIIRYGRGGEEYEYQES